MNIIVTSKIIGLENRCKTENKFGIYLDSGICVIYYFNNNKEAFNCYRNIKDNLENFISIGDYALITVPYFANVDIIKV